jgi:hypothetical protein
MVGKAAGNKVIGRMMIDGHADMLQKREALRARHPPAWKLP